jgi:hypothetical protein
MPGGLLNLVAYGNQNIMLNGNPSKTFFKTSYAKYTNFGLQKFRIDIQGQRSLRLNESSVFDFVVPRYGDLLMDTYVVVNLPSIWSPIMPPFVASFESTESTFSPLYQWQPYEFKWIEHLGSHMIERVRFTAGGIILQEFTGDYMYNLVERDFTNTKKELYYKMTGHVTEMNDPSNAYGRQNQYPHAVYAGTNGIVTDSTYAELYNKLGSEPSIRGREIYIPLNIWFTMASKMAFPLISLQYVELKIEITIRPVRELFTVNRIYVPNDTNTITLNETNTFTLNEANTFLDTQQIRVNFNEQQYLFYRFLQSPPTVGIYDATVYLDKRTNWDADIHLISTYAFLSEDEARRFASEPQSYLVRESYTTPYYNVVGSSRINLDSLGMVSSWMWYFQRSDVSDRNQWSNYTNWSYDTPPVQPREVTQENSTGLTLDNSSYYPLTVNNNNLYTSGVYTNRNTRDIMITWALLMDGKYRENELSSGVLEYIEPYIRTPGTGREGVYYYNFALSTNPYDFQPSGAINLSKFSSIQFEITTIQPPLDANVQFTAICSPTTGEIVGTSMPQSGIYRYQYNLVVMEERYNILTIQNGLAGLEYTR